MWSHLAVRTGHGLTGAVEVRIRQLFDAALKLLQKLVAGL